MAITIAGYEFNVEGKIGEANNCKKAIIVVGFFTYLIYLGVQALAHWLEYKKSANEKLITTLKDIKSELEQRNFFFLVFIMLTQILTPLPFPTIMVFFYLFICLPMIFLGYFDKEKFTKVRMIGVGLQVLLLFILFLIVLIDAWYRQLFFRYSTASVA
jgi:hypothetical protein